MSRQVPAFDADYRPGSPLIQALLEVAEGATKAGKEGSTGAGGTGGGIGTGTGAVGGGAVRGDATEGTTTAGASNVVELRWHGNNSSTNSGHLSPQPTTARSTQPTTARSTSTVASARSARSATTAAMSTTGGHGNVRGHHRPHIAKNESELHGMSLLVADKVPMTNRH